MIEFKAENKPKIAVLLDNRVEVTFVTDRTAIREFDGLRDKELTVTVKEYKAKRSLSQNAYLWVLLNEIAKKVNRSKEQVYREFVKDFGVFEILPIRNEAVESFKFKWSKNGLGWITEDLGESKMKGFTKLVAYYGSSTYNREEMRRLIDAVVTECQDLGIQTMSLADIDLLQNENE